MDKAIEGLAEKVELNLNEIANQAIESAVEVGTDDKTYEALNPEVGYNLENEQEITPVG